MIEEWRDILGYEGLYQVSSNGRVRSYDRLITTTFGRPWVLPGRILKKTLHPDGYEYVWLFRAASKRKRSEKVHRLVANAFHGERDSRWDVDHVNGNRADNNYTNVRWASRAQNLRNRHVIKGRSGAVGVFPNNSSVRPWRVYVTHDYKKHYVGAFSNIEEATAARNAFIAKIDQTA